MAKGFTRTGEEFWIGGKKFFEETKPKQVQTTIKSTLGHPNYVILISYLPKPEVLVAPDAFYSPSTRVLGG